MGTAVVLKHLDPSDAGMNSVGGRRTLNQIKSSKDWQESMWRQWKESGCWPAILDVYEAAAYLRVSPDTIRRALVCGRDGRARLAHHRIGSVHRIRRTDIDVFGKVDRR